MKFIILSLFVFLLVTVSSQTWDDEDVVGWHWHTYFFDQNRRSAAEASSYRRAMREKIQDGTFRECWLNMVRVGADVPHPSSHFELCCNATTAEEFKTVHSWVTQNHGNLTTLIHPLTVNEPLDHTDRASWIGRPVKLDSSRLPMLPAPRPCTNHGDYSDDIQGIVDGVVVEVPPPFPFP